MRNLKIGLMAVMCILTIGLCVLFVYGITGHNIYRSVNKNHVGTHLVLEKEIPIDGIDSISVLYNMNSNDIFLYESDDNILTVKEYSCFELGEEEVSTVKVSGSRLEIKGQKRNYQIAFGINMENYVEVWLPSSYCGKLKLQTISGDITSEPVLALTDDFEASSTSGDVSIPEISAKNAIISSISGYIRTDGINTNRNGKNGKISITTTSGDIQLGQLAGETDICSISGDIQFGELAGKAGISTTSGCIKAERIEGSVQLTTTSGDMDIQCIDGNVKASTTSGYVNIYDGSGDRTISTSSGDIMLEKMNGSFDINATSGEVSMTVQKGEGHVETSSGDIRLELSELTGKLKLNSTSGETMLKLSADSSFDFEANTTSGSIDTFFDDDLQFSKKKNSAQGTYGNSVQGHLVDIETTSGDVRVTKL